MRAWSSGVDVRSTRIQLERHREDPPTQPDLTPQEQTDLMDQSTQTSISHLLPPRNCVRTVNIRKLKSCLGLAIEGGADTSKRSIYCAVCQIYL